VWYLVGSVGVHRKLKYSPNFRFEGLVSFESLLVRPATPLWCLANSRDMYRGHLERDFRPQCAESPQTMCYQVRMWYFVGSKGAHRRQTYSLDFRFGDPVFFNLLLEGPATPLWYFEDSGDVHRGHPGFPVPRCAGSPQTIRFQTI